MRNGVFKIKCFGQKMRKCLRSVPHFPRQNCSRRTTSPRKSCHTLGKVALAARNCCRSMRSRECGFDKFHRKTVIALVLPYGLQLNSSIYLCQIQATLKFVVWVALRTRCGLSLRDHLRPPNVWLSIILWELLQAIAIFEEAIVTCL